MTNLRAKRSKIAAFVAVLVLSSTIMLLLLWRFPLKTLIAAGLVIGVFAIATLLARSLDIDGLADGKRRDHGV